jgi:hypothetical protein
MLQEIFPKCNATGIQKSTLKILESKMTKLNSLEQEAIRFLQEEEKIKFTKIQFGPTFYNHSADGSFVYAVVFAGNFQTWGFYEWVENGLTVNDWVKYRDFNSKELAYDDFVNFNTAAHNNDDCTSLGIGVFYLPALKNDDQPIDLAQFGYGLY